MATYEPISNKVEGKMTKYEKLVDFYFHPEFGDTKEERRVACGEYRATVIEHTNMFTKTSENWVIFDGPNLEGVTDIEHTWSKKETEELLEDFGKGVHQDGRCRCGWKPGCPE